MIEIKPSLCTECRICMTICSWTHYSEYNIKRARIAVEAEWPKTPQIGVCQACAGHECVQACSQNALTWESWILLDKERCNSCRECVEACPVDGITMDPITNLPLVCDTCEGDFQCVAWCPTQALLKGV